MYKFEKNLSLILPQKPCVRFTIRWRLYKALIVALHCKGLMVMCYQCSGCGVLSETKVHYDVVVWRYSSVFWWKSLKTKIEIMLFNCYMLLEKSDTIMKVLIVTKITHTVLILTIKPTSPNSKNHKFESSRWLKSINQARNQVWNYDLLPRR